MYIYKIANMNAGLAIHCTFCMKNIWQKRTKFFFQLFLGLLWCQDRSTHLPY